MWFRTKPAKISIIETLKDTYERQIALLQEQLADARADAQRHCERADAAADHLIRLIGLPAISRQGKLEAAENQKKVAERMEKAARTDLFDDLAFGHDDGVFKSREEAALTHG